MKPISEALKCEIGYKNSFGEVIIEDLSTTGSRFTSHEQAIKTKLPSPDDSSNILHVFTRCYDVYGRHKTAAVTITIESEDTVEFDSNSSDRYTESF